MYERQGGKEWDKLGDWDWCIYAGTATTAKSLQSCPTLCDPIDGSPPGSPVPGILQARTLEWVAISFSNAWKWKVKRKSLSRVQLLATPWTAAYQAPPSMGFARQEYWSGVPSPSRGLISASLPSAPLLPFPLLCSTLQGHWVLKAAFPQDSFQLGSSWEEREGEKYSGFSPFPASHHPANASHQLRPIYSL